MADTKPLIHQRGQVKGKVTAISHALEKAEDDKQDRPTVVPNMASMSSQTSSESVQSATVSSSYSLANSAVLPNVLLLTAQVNLVDCNGQFVPCRAFLDCGAQVNLLSLPMYEKLGFQGKSVDVRIFGVSDTQSKSNRFVTVDMQSMYSDFRLSLNCFVTPKITGLLPCKPINVSDLKLPCGFQLADPNFHRPSEVDLLIGNQHFFKLLKPGSVVISRGLPEFRETYLGWVASGEVVTDSDAVANYQQVHSVSLASLDRTIKQFWEVEEVEVKRSRFEDDEQCEESFRQNHRRDSTGRYIVKLPLKENSTQLQSNRSLALRRFHLLERRLNKDPDLRLQYSNFIREYESLGHCKEVFEFDDPPNLLKYYMPHHAVLRPDSLSTKSAPQFRVT
ncbi:uncharacterized protein LOC135709573 [Ochlerotatus camptorhynchus]|uniref:uncharacterized protein LOC135709573 n=1 Tax=Ochlerotatus camptorhynchus TaxID=644619 RepID=UPI0031D5501E